MHVKLTFIRFQFRWVALFCTAFVIDAARMTSCFLIDVLSRLCCWTCFLVYSTCIWNVVFLNYFPSLFPYFVILMALYDMGKPFTYSVRVYILNTSTSICCIQNHICKFSAAIISYMSYLYYELTYFYLNLPVPQSPLLSQSCIWYSYWTVLPPCAHEGTWTSCCRERCCLSGPAPRLEHESYPLHAVHACHVSVL